MIDALLSSFHPLMVLTFVSALAGIYGYLHFLDNVVMA